MDKKLTLLAAPMIMLASSTAAAHAKRSLTPYLGIDAQWRHTNFRKGFGDNLFKHDYQQANVYTGIKICDAIAIEAGYEATNKMARHNLLNAGVLSAGTDLERATEYRSSGHFKGPHINLVGFIPIYKPYNLNLIASIGVAHLKMNFIRQALLVYTGVGPVSPLVIGDSGIDTFQKRKAILRLGLGIEHKLCEHWGIRGMVLWENTERFKMNSQQVPSASINVKNSVTYSIGAFRTF